mmetsp:Transcript_12780/g.26425  ORF Transcript_12780/g.26425 Transcript_12780/m.26425 type:complete len:164 (-) Transcript_12780:706-1197(-)
MPHKVTLYTAPLRAIDKTIFLIAGTDTRHVHAVAVRAMDMAEKGKASFSSTKAAVPNPCAAAPMPMPLATGFFIPAAVKIAAPKLAPKRPVTTTMLTAMLTVDALAPKRPAIAMANGLVIFRDKSATRNDGCSNPIKRTIHAVPNKPPREETDTAVAICKKLS